MTENVDLMLLCCSFCGRNQTEVTTLIAGPAISVCDECVSIMGEIVADQQNGQNGAAPSKDGTVDQTKGAPGGRVLARNFSELESSRLLRLLTTQRQAFEGSGHRLVEIVRLLRHRGVDEAEIQGALAAASATAVDWLLSRAGRALQESGDSV